MHMCNMFYARIITGAWHAKYVITSIYIKYAHDNKPLYTMTNDQNAVYAYSFIHFTKLYEIVQS